MQVKSEKAKASSHFSVGRLGAKFGLSRTALLYYDKIGLLKPSGRSIANYRVYTQADFDRLGQICKFRSAGLGLTDISKLLASRDNEFSKILETRLEQLKSEIMQRRTQQKLIINILKSGAVKKTIGPMTKEKWMGLLKASGFSPEDMKQWHIDFENTSPSGHQKFLIFLGLSNTEIKQIRSRSKVF